MTRNRSVATATEDSLQAAVAAAAAKCLRTPLRTIGPDVPFSLLGLDSLAAIELAAALEDTVGSKLPAGLLAECPDLRSLTARLQQIGLNEGRKRPEDPFDRMLADAVLPEDVRPVRRVPDSVALENARAILLTGATGFLGAALAKEILHRSAATLVCLMRPHPKQPGESRLRQHLAAHGVEDRLFNSRVRTIDGDLSMPKLDLGDERLDALALEVDAICHAGAAVNWVYSYGGLRAANVAGTTELLRLACRREPIPFHFVSSLSVCYSTSAPREVDEQFDALPHLRGLHLGYAQTKAVAESLVRQAGDRGLPIRIYRPALISGNSITGAFNRDDVVATLIRGCVRMGTAPDLDWKLDSLPVDVVARSVVSLSGHPGPVFHLAHAHPRHWRECVLWMRLYGYPIRLVSYHRWLQQLDRETEPNAATSGLHPLRTLRSFFLDRVADARGLTLPEIHEEARRSRATDEGTRRADPTLVAACPALDATLLATYFRAFVDSGELPAPLPIAPTTGASRQVRALCLDTAFLARALPGLRVVGAEQIGCGSETSIISELTAWRSRRPSGVFRVRLTLDEHGRRITRDVIVKAKPLDVDVVAVGDALANLCDPAIGRAYASWSARLGAGGSHARELAVYAQTDRRFVRHAPAVLGAIADAETDTWLVILEHINDACAIDSADRPDAWTPDRLDLAVRGLASLQAIWYGREQELRATAWMGCVPSAHGMAEASDLWTALAHHASPAFSSWADPGIASIQRRLIASIGQWWPALERSPRTLIHHDFNPRNLCIRGTAGDMRLCAYDWELATVGAPQRDLAELLCFVLPPVITGDDIERWIERHRAALACETGTTLEPAAWRDGFRAALYDVLINRLGMYALVHRIRRQPFLPRVVQAWCRLYRHFREEHAR